MYFIFHYKRKALQCVWIPYIFCCTGGKPLRACQYHAVPVQYRAKLWMVMAAYTVSTNHFIWIYRSISIRNLLGNFSVHKRYIPLCALTRENKSKRYLRDFYMHISSVHQSNFEAVSDSICCFHKAGALRAACIWFHREVVNMPVFSTSLLFWHAQLRQSSSKVSAWGCGHCRSAFTHTNLHFSGFSPQYGWMLLRVSSCRPWIKRWRTA